MIRGREKSHGFSFVEVMGCIALIGILSGVAIGGLNSLSDYTFRHFTTQTKYFIQSAQQQASRENSVYRISHLKEDSKYIIKKNNEEAVGGDDEDSEKLIVPDGIKVAISTRDEDIIFSKDMSPTKAATVTLLNERTGEETVMTIQVATGEIIVREGANG